MSLQAAGPEIVLASGSATRRAMLDAAGLRFRVQPIAVDEAALREAARQDGAGADEAALLLANAKAARVREPDALVIGADQILVCEGEWLEKPADMAAARAQLLHLRGRAHELVTAVACFRRRELAWDHVDVARLVMRDFSEAFLDDYLALEGEAILGSVGAYRLEGMGIHLFDRVEGAHATILGLPMTPLLGFLRQHGVLLT